MRAGMAALGRTEDDIVGPMVDVDSFRHHRVVLHIIAGGVVQQPDVADRRIVDESVVRRIAVIPKLVCCVV